VNYNSRRCSFKVAKRQCSSKFHGANANNTTGLEDDEEPSSRALNKALLIKIGVTRTRGRGNGRVRGNGLVAENKFYCYYFVRYY